MDDGEQGTQGLPQAPAVGLLAWVRQGQQELDISNQVGQTELHGDAAVPHVLALGTKVIAAQDALEVCPQNVQQYPRATRGIDVEDGELLGTKAPAPERFAVV